MELERIGREMTEIPSKFPLPDSLLERRARHARLRRGNGVIATDLESRGYRCGDPRVRTLVTPALGMGGHILELIYGKSTPGDVQTPAWSPDGRKLAFVSGRDGNAEIYVMNADGSEQENLTRQPANDSHPSWSPDGRKIAFVSRRDGNRRST